MNILIDLLPDTVIINNNEYEIESNFRTSILFELMFEDRDLRQEELIYNALNLYFPNQKPQDLKMAIQAIMWFFSCGKLFNEGQDGGQRGGNKVQKIYSFEHDAEYIYSAFLTQYGIDLQDIEYLHWWKFRAMFNSLNEDLKISKIMHFRSVRIDNKMSKEEKKYYREMKRLYSLPDTRTEEEKEIDFYNALSSIM